MELRKNDPEFAERFQHFAFDEVVNEENQQLDAAWTLIGKCCQSHWKTV